MDNEIVTKISDTEIEIKQVIPEQVIPEQVNTRVISIGELNSQKEGLEAKRSILIKRKETTELTINNLNNDILDIENQIADVQKYIDIAEAQNP